VDFLNRIKNTKLEIRNKFQNKILKEISINQPAVVEEKPPFQPARPSRLPAPARNAGHLIIFHLILGNWRLALCIFYIFVLPLYRPEFQQTRTAIVTKLCIFWICIQTVFTSLVKQGTAKHAKVRPFQVVVIFTA
jgi:hypothetical protein